jgi:UDP-glucose 4-epimerase
MSALEEGDMTRRKPDISKMKTLLDRPMLPFEDGMKIIIENSKFIL